MQREIIIITGTSSGIGYELAKYYLEEGYTVIGMSRHKNKNLDTYQNYNHYIIDITHQKAVRDTFDEIKMHDYYIKLIVLNAGILGVIKEIHNTNIDNAKEVMETNLWANKLIMDEILLQEIPCRQVIAISSGAAKNGNAGWGSYSISKAALNILIQTYAAEQQHIHFTAVAPGLVDTAMQEYITSVKSVDKFPSLRFLHDAKGTIAMPDPSILAPKLAELFEKAMKTVRSGKFIDIRD